MKYIFLVFIFSIAAIASENLKPYKIDNRDYYFKIPAKIIKPFCEKSPNTSNWFGAIDLKGDRKQSWFFRAPIDKDHCSFFLKKVEKMLKETDTIDIFGDTRPNEDGSTPENFNFGAMKGTETCYEWFVGDCKNFKKSANQRSSESPLTIEE